ncbi:MAG TPA: hypothetical protein VG125_07135 [Pirellulales bacterium]|jgi:hypothetical protein|nr:hypothetical protein [Pirellulales bacterium]
MQSLNEHIAEKLRELAAYVQADRRSPDFCVPEEDRCSNAQVAGSGAGARVLMCSLVGGHDAEGHAGPAQPHRCHAGHDLRHRVIATWCGLLLLLFVLAAATPAEAKWCSKKHPKPGCPPAAALFLR